MTERELSVDERDDWMRIEGANGTRRYERPAPADLERDLTRSALLAEHARTWRDPSVYVQQARDAAARATGGESCNPGRDEQSTGEGR